MRSRDAAGGVSPGMGGVGSPLGGGMRLRLREGGAHKEVSVCGVCIQCFSVELFSHAVRTRALAFFDACV